MDAAKKKERERKKKKEKEILTSILVHFYPFRASRVDKSEYTP